MSVRSRGRRVRAHSSVQHAGLRTCVGCRRRDERSQLLRVVASPGGSEFAPGVGARTVVPDECAKLPGRGAWLHPQPDCLDQAERRRAFLRALRLDGAVDCGPVRAWLATHPLDVRPYDEKPAQDARRPERADDRKRV